MINWNKILNEVSVPGVNKTDSESDQLKALSKKNKAASKHMKRAKDTNNVGWMKMLKKRKTKYKAKGKQIREDEKPGLWANIRAKRKRVGKKGMAKKGSKAFKDAVAAGKKIKANELFEGQFCPQCLSEVIQGLHENHRIEEAEYQGRKVKLNKPMQGDVKKFKVYVKDGDSVKKVNFGDKGGAVDGSTLKIKKNNPEKRAAFRARHKCDQKKSKTSAGYWSCKKW